MAKLSDLKLRYRIFVQTYRYRQYDWHPGAVLQKPLSQARTAVVTAAAFFRPDQAPFDASIRGGDYSFREIPLGTDLDALQIGHRSKAFDHSGVESDKNLALPLDRLRELKAEARICAAPLQSDGLDLRSGALGNCHRRGDRTEATGRSNRWRLAHIGLTSLSSVRRAGPKCNREVGHTVSISLLREVTERVKPPRALVVDRSLGYPLGAPHHASLQKRIVMAALELLMNPVREPLLVEFQEGVPV